MRRPGLLLVACALPLGNVAAPQSGSASRPAQRYALLVAVNEYPTSIPPLKEAPANDLTLMRNLLVQRLGFSGDDVRVLRDREATRANIVEAVRRHLGQAGPNDLALFYFTGHGVRLGMNIGLGRDSDVEADSTDDAMLVWGKDSAAAAILLDEELGLLLDELSARRVVAVIDACHSGTSTRAADVEPIAWSEFGGAPPPSIAGPRARPAPNTPKRVLWTDTKPRIELPDSLLTSGAVPERRPHLLLAAALETEVAFAGTLRMPDGALRRASLFTTALYHALWNASPDRTLEQTIQRAGSIVMRIVRRAEGVTQTPNATGALREETLAHVFGLTSPPRKRSQ